MPLDLVTIRCLTDNFAYLLHGAGETVLVDAPEAGPILAVLAERGWRLDRILLTHHHDDHVQAVPALLPQAFDADTQALVRHWLEWRYRLIPYVLGIIEDAVRTGLKKCAKSVKNIKGAWINETKVVTDDQGNIIEWRVNMRVSFVVE